MNGSGFDYLSNKKNLYGGSGGGSASSGGGKFIGYVKNGDTNFPSGAEKNDFVKVDTSNTVFPFTIQNITFSNKNDQAIYTGSQWILYSFIVETKNIEVSNPQQESLTNKTLQSQINTENKEKFEEIDERLKKMYNFIGFISITEPTGQIENNIYWYNSAILPTTFPIQVKVYSNGAWSTETIDYTPANFDTWSNKNDDKGYYWFANNWNINDANVLTDNITIEINNNGEIQLKNNGITFFKLNANLYNNQVANENNKFPLNEAVFKEILNNTNSNFSKSYSNNNLDLTINLKDNNNTSKIDKTTTLLTKISDYVSLTDTDKLSFLDITTQELKDVALSAVNNYIQNKINVGDGLTKDTNNVIKHSNSITAQTTQKIGVCSFDAQGHITGFSERPILTAVDENSTDQQLISAKNFYDNSLLFEIYNITDVLDLTNSNFRISNTTKYNACCILKKDKSMGRLLLNFYTDSSTAQTNAGWKRISLLNSNFPYKAYNPNNSSTTAEVARNLGSMWDGSGYSNLAISIYLNGDIQTYYYNAILNKTGGMNIALDIPITKK